MEEEEGFINGYDEDKLFNGLPPPTPLLVQEAQQQEQREREQQQVIQYLMQIRTTQNIPDNEIHREETLPPLPPVQQVPIPEVDPNILIVPRQDGVRIALDRNELFKLGYVMNIKSDLLFSDQNRIINDYSLVYNDDFVGSLNIFYSAPQDGKLGYYATDIGPFSAYRLYRTTHNSLISVISNSIPKELKSGNITFWSFKFDARKFFMFYYLFYYCLDIEEFDLYITKKYQESNNEEEQIIKFDLRRHFDNKGFYLSIPERRNESNTTTGFIYFSCSIFNGLHYFNFATNFLTKLPAKTKEQPVLEIGFRVKIFDSGYLRLYESLRSIFWMNSIIMTFYNTEIYDEDNNKQRKYYIQRMEELNQNKFKSARQQVYPDDDPVKYPGEVQVYDSIFNSQNYSRENIIANDYALSIINMTRHGLQQQPEQEQLQYNAMDNNLDTISAEQNKPEKSMEEINMHE